MPFKNIRISKFLTKVAKEQVVAILKYIGKKTMPIVAWHFLVYCFVKMAYVWCYNLDRTLVATKEAIRDPKWIAIYVVCGLIGSLLIDEIVSEIKGSMPLQRSTRRCVAAKKEKAKATAYTIRLRQPIDSTLANYSYKAIC